VSAGDDHPHDLQLWFQALNSQTLPADVFEVIVVDPTHFIDYEVALARFQAETKARASISCHRVERSGRARALNRALEMATGDLIIFLGDDVVPSPGLAEAHLRFHEAHPEAEAVGIGATILEPAMRTKFSVWLEESGRLFGVPFRADMTEVPEDFFYVANASVKRKLLERAGRFDERFTHHAWDDFEFGVRLRALGMRTRFVPDARGSHVHDITLLDRERDMRTAGAAARVFLIDHPEAQKWLEPAHMTSWRHGLRTATARVRRAAGTDDALVKWWHTRLDAAFAAGYRGGV
jgi:GT2 family glycosyltransferase